MGFLRALLVLWLVVLPSPADAKIRCLFCLDHAYLNFVQTNALDDNDRRMGYPSNIVQQQCKDLIFAYHDCEDSCIRVHLANATQTDGIVTVGYIFACSSNIIDRPPNNLNLPQNLRNFNGTLKYTDQLGDNMFFEVTFYREVNQSIYPVYKTAETNQKNYTLKINAFLLLFVVAVAIFFSVKKFQTIIPPPTDSTALVHNREDI